MFDIIKKFLFIAVFTTFLSSCVEQVYKIRTNKVFTLNSDDKNEPKSKKYNNNDSEKQNIEIAKNESINEDKSFDYSLHVVLPEKEKYEYTAQSFLNTLEIAIFDNQNDITFNIDMYKDENDLKKIFSSNQKKRRIFIGPLTSKDTEKIKEYCNDNTIIFSFASDRSLAGNCLYLFNFFIEDDLRKIFSYLDEKNKVALIYPENKYGTYVNNIIKNYSSNSKATLIYKMSYRDDLSNIRETIKQLGKYEFRKKELEKQKDILKNKNDEVSKAALKKLERFETIGTLDFNNLIISDGNLRILEIAPLLPFYDIDPNNIRFIGTGLWDEKSFFDEPSLQGAIFPGTEEFRRKKFIDRYLEIYQLPPPRITTAMYDLVSLVSLLSSTNNDIYEIKEFLNTNSFNGLDGQFSIVNNIVKRELSILKIINGKAELIN